MSPSRAPTPLTRVEEIWPLLRVADVERSLHFYRDGLGFELVGRAGEGGDLFWCRLRRGGACVMLQRSDPPARAEDSPGLSGGGIVLYFVCDDVDALYDELRGRGLSVEPPVDAYYGMRQLEIPEPDGHALCFETRTEEWSQ